MRKLGCPSRSGASAHAALTRRLVLLFICLLISHRAATDREHRTSVDGLKIPKLMATRPDPIGGTFVFGVCCDAFMQSNREAADGVEPPSGTETPRSCRCVLQAQGAQARLGVR